MTVRVTVTLPDDVLATLDAIAESEGLSRSEVVREASARYVAGRKAGKAASKRGSAVADGLAWLQDVAAADGPDSLASLRTLRGSDHEALGRPIPVEDDPGIP